MKLSVSYGRYVLPLSLVLLAGCQTAPIAPATANEQGSKPIASESRATVPHSGPAASSPAAHQGAPVAIFMATRQIQPGWTPVPAPTGTLYVNPTPFLTRSDLTEVKAGGTAQGQGWLLLGLNSAGTEKTRTHTSENPGKGLALVIGRTMMPLMSYSAPITDGQLVFYISTEENAVAAARAIAGVKPEPDTTATGGSAQGTTQAIQATPLPVLP